MAQTGTSGAAIGAPAPLPAALAAQAAAAAASSSESAANKDLPRDARIIGLLLASLGATDAEPGVVARLLEFAHRMLLGLQSRRCFPDSSFGRLHTRHTAVSFYIR